MPLILRIMDLVSDKGKPVSQTYFDLWCRNWDNDGFVIASQPKVMAYYSGFSGERAESTWKTRVSILEKLGFVKLQEGATGSAHYILIPNPYNVIQKLHKEKKIPIAAYNSLRERLIEIGETAMGDGK
jgi:hypothetical protein